MEFAVDIKVQNEFPPKTEFEISISRHSCIKHRLVDVLGADLFWLCWSVRKFDAKFHFESENAAVGQIPARVKYFLISNTYKRY